jgi:hypothetical protein
MDTKETNNLFRQMFQMLKSGFDGLTKAINKDVHKVEIIGVKTITLKGDTPTNEELLKLIVPLIPKIRQPEDGHTPTDEELLGLIKPLIPKVKNGETPTDERLLDLIRPLIPILPDPTTIALEASKLAQAEIKPLIKPNLSTDEIADNLDNLPKAWLSVDHIRGDFNTRVKQVIVPPALTQIQVLDEGGNTYYVDKLNFAGEGVTLVNMGSGVATVTIPGGGGGSGGDAPTIYTETPSGDIDGVNTTYTSENVINTVYSFAIFGQFIHPGQYTINNQNIISFIEPLPADLSGKPFTLIYS